MHSEKLKYNELCSFLLQKRSLFCAGRSIERTAGCPAVTVPWGTEAAVCCLSVSTLVVCVRAPLLVQLLQAYYRVLTDNMAKINLTDAEIRNILEQMDADNILK